MQAVPASLVVSYVLFSFFLLYQQLYVRNFRDEGRALRAAVGALAVGGMVFAYGFLLYWGWAVDWMQAVLLLVLSLALKLVWFPIEAKLGLRQSYRRLSLPGFVVMPVCAVVMVASLP